MPAPFTLVDKWTVMVGIALEDYLMSTDGVLRS